jgi:hypothetical protein
MSDVPDCPHNSSVVEGSRRVPRPCVLAIRAGDSLRRQGLRATVKRIVAFVRRRANTPAAKAETQTAARVRQEEVLNLRAGELVGVKSETEIRSTLDSTGKLRGIRFMSGMYAYCGKRLRVYKPVQRILLEGNGEVRRLRNTVLLEGSICDGETFVCDRSCFYFWKEAWLRRVVREETGTGGNPVEYRP